MRFGLPVLVAAESVRHRVTSGVVEGFSTWWEMPALLLAVTAVAVFVIAVYRRDAVDLSRPLRLLLAALRLGALAAVVAAYLDFERTTEREIEFPSRVAVLVDASGSMSLADGPATAAAPAPSRGEQAIAALRSGGLLEALRARQDVAIWRFDAAAERLAVLPRATAAAGVGDATSATDADAVVGAVAEADWGDRLAFQGAETRLGDALVRVLDEEPAGVLAGVVLLTDGVTTAGTDPRAAAAALAAADVAVHPLGIGSDVAPPGVRVADILAPARVFPDDAFAVTAHLQPQGLEGRRVRVELSASAEAAASTPIDALDVVLGPDGELVPIRFNVAGLSAPGRRTLDVRVRAAAGDTDLPEARTTADIEVVDRVTRVLLMAGGPGREYQFMRNVLQRDESFSVDVLLGTAADGMSQDARRILDAFPTSDEALADYDAVVAFDYDWRRLDLTARTRLERWVARESGGLLLVAGGVFMDAWLADPQMMPIRNLFPLELRGSGQFAVDAAARDGEPQPIRFTRDGMDAEFLWLAGTRGASEAAWGEFSGIYARCPAGPAKPGATVYARLDSPGSTAASGSAGSTSAGDSRPIFLAGQLYGSGTVLYAGSGELWRLRSVDVAAHERLTTQLVRHASQGRLLRGSRRGRLLVDQERYPVGGVVTVRLVVPEAGGRAASCRVVGPDGSREVVALIAEPGRGDALRGSFVATREGVWEVSADLGVRGDEPLVRRVQAHLPDRELAQPRIDRRLLEELAATTGGQPRFLHAATWKPEAARELAASLPDRSRREYEATAPDPTFKQRLNGILLAIAAGLLCGEWIVRRLVTLA